MNVEIVRKWYNELPFSNKYDEEFEKLLVLYKNTSIKEFGEYTFNEDAKKDFLACLYFCEALEKQYNEAGISREILLNTLLDIVIYTDVHFDLTGELGFSETDWLKRHFSLKIFRLGRLQFGMEDCFRDIDKIGVKASEPVLGIHIPRGVPLNLDECHDSLAAAREFFREKFPDFQYKCFTCYSWLLDDTLLQIVKADSNIIKFQNLFDVIYKNECYDILGFTMGKNIKKANLADYTPINSFTERVKNYVMNGGKFYIAFGYIEK